MCLVFILTVESLLKQGVSPNPSNADGLTPLHRVSYSLLAYIDRSNYNDKGIFLMLANNKV